MKNIETKKIEILESRLIAATEENHKQLMLIRRLQAEVDTLNKIKLVLKYPNSRVLLN